MRRFGRNIAFLGGGLLLLALADLYFEPFAKRVDGKTPSAWLKVFADRGKVDEQIVEAFGTNEVAFLVGAVERGQFFNNVYGLIREALNIPRSSSARQINSRMLAAGTWLSWLAANGHKVSDRRMNKIAQWLDIYDDQFYAPRWVQLSLTSPVEAAAEREKLKARSDVFTQPQAIPPSVSSRKFISKRLLDGNIKSHDEQ